MNIQKTPERIGFELVLDKYPSKSAMARAIGKHCSHVRYWEKIGEIPAEYCPLYEKALGIPREQIRPDLFSKKINKHR